MSGQNYSGSFFLDHHPEWGDEVLRKKDQSVQHPLEINEPFAWVLGVICVVGFALNFEIIVHILYDKNMLLKPKYIIQLAIAFSGLLILFAIAIVVINFCFGPSDFLCHFFVAFLMGISYNCFLLNYSLFLIECFVAISFPIWHLVYVTPRRVVYGLIGLNLVMAMAMEWPLIIGTIPVRCALQPSHGLYLNGTASILFGLSFAFCFIDFVIAWLYLPRSSSQQAAVIIPSIIISPPSPLINNAIDYNPASPVQDIEVQDSSYQHPPGCRRLSVITEKLENDEDIETTDEDEVSDSNAVRVDVRAIPDDISCTPLSPIEWRAIKAFLIGVLPLFLIPLPLFTFYFSFHLICEQTNSSSSSFVEHQQQQSDQCTDLTWLTPYLFFLLVSLHSLVNPITSLRLKEFQRPSPIRRLRIRMMPWL